MGTIVKDGTIVYTHIDDIPRGAMEIRIPVPEGYVAEIISDGLIAIRPVESEGEKIRKEIVSFIRAFWVDHRYSVPQTSKWLDWLEKKKDSPMPEDTVIFQKGVEEGRRLEREDMEKERKPITDLSEFSDAYREGYNDCLNESIKNRGNSPQSNTNSPSWSEEDEKQIRQIERIVKNAGCSKMLQEKIHNWLKSLRPQPHWKPSEEQMRCLQTVVQEVNKKSLMSTTGYSPAAVLQSLYIDLKALM